MDQNSTKSNIQEITLNSNIQTNSNVIFLADIKIVKVDLVSEINTLPKEVYRNHNLKLLNESLY